MPLVQLQGVTVAFGGAPVLDEVDLVVEGGERLCLLGRNGAGKSTLLSVLDGSLEPDDGSIVRATGLRTAMLEQRIPPGVTGSVRDLVTSGLLPHERDGDAERRVLSAISRVGLDPESDVAPLSAGLTRRALLARALAHAPDLLLLDEPTNHLDVESIRWLEDLLRRDKLTLLFVTHDRAFLRRLATGILDLDRGHLTRFGPDYDAYRDAKNDAEGVEAKRAALFDKRLATEENWIRQGVRERRKRNQGRVQRLMEMRRDRAGRREGVGTVKMEASSAGRSGRVVVKTTDLGYSWDGVPAVRDLTTTVMRGDRLGILGPNGSGKTTLLRLLLGDLEPMEGTVKRGVNLEVAYFDQLHAHLDDHVSAGDNVSGGRPSVTVNGKSRHVIGYLRDFLFTPDQVRSPIHKFSGGERNRLLLARLFATPSNVLVLDEPTNDLDVETLEVLEGLLSDYEGTVIVVSHDRELLDHVVTSTLVFEGEGRIREYVGGWSDAERQRKEEATPAAKPARRGRSPRAKPTPTLSREERKELNDLPARIETHEAEQAALHAEMADPAFFKRSGEQIAEAQARLAALEQALETSYARWEALEAKR